jgi:xanthine/CO dehydrogenase XdhC/CoxF family maturation factor
LGAIGPEEIAVSIAAELVAVKRGRVPLRSRSVPLLEALHRERDPHGALPKP